MLLLLAVHPRHTSNAESKTEYKIVIFHFLMVTTLLQSSTKNYHIYTHTQDDSASQYSIFMKQSMQNMFNNVCCYKMNPNF